MKLVRLLAVGLALAGPACAVEDAAAARATLSAWSARPDSRAGREGWTRRTRTATFELGPVTYAAKYDAADPPGGGPADPGEGPIGLPRPDSENWYHGGFMHVTVNGKSWDPVPLTSFELVENGPRAVAQMIFRNADGALRVRFIGLPGDDKLLLEVTAEPTAPLLDLTLRMVAYPSFFTSHHKRAGARRTLTPAGVVAQDETRELPPEQGWWAVLYDEVFDPAKGEGQGPCALAVDPEALASVRIEPRSYPSHVILKAKPGVNRVRLAIWEFPDLPNADATARFPAAAESALATLRGLDATPPILKQFDPAEGLAELQAARADQAIAEQFGDRLDGFEAWLQSAKLLTAGAAPLSIVDEERFLLGYREQTEMLWELRLARLLNGL